MGLLNAGVNLGPLHAGVSADAQLPAAIGSLFPFSGAAVDAGGGKGVGVDASGGVHGNNQGAGVDVNLGGQAGSSGHGQDQEGSGAGASINMGGDQGFGGEVGIGGDGHNSAGAQGGAGVGVILSPVPIVSVTAPAGPDSPQCTVYGGAAKMLYFPPAGQQGSLDSNNNQDGPAPPAPAAGTPYATHGQVFQPGSAYISCETLYAAYTDNKGSTIQTGPTFTNAIFPFPSDQISTQCVDAQQTDAPAFNQGQQMDFGLAGSLPSSCMNIVAPTAMASLVPEWSEYHFWNMDFQPPEQICSEGAPKPQGPAWTGPPPECSCKPTVVLPSSTEVPTVQATTASMPGPPSSPVPTSAATLTGPLPSSFGAYTATRGQSISGTSSSPAQYTGSAPRACFGRSGKSTLGITMMLIAVLLL